MLELIQICTCSQRPFDTDTHNHARIPLPEFQSLRQGLHLAGGGRAALLPLCRWIVVE